MSDLIFDATATPCTERHRMVWALAAARHRRFQLHCAPDPQHGTLYVLVIDGKRHDLGPLSAALFEIRQLWPLREREEKSLPLRTVATLAAIDDGEWHTAIDVGKALGIHPATAAARLRALAEKGVLAVEPGKAGFSGKATRWRIASVGGAATPRSAPLPPYQRATLQVMGPSWLTTQEIARRLNASARAAYHRLQTLRRRRVVMVRQVQRVARGRVQLEWRIIGT